LTARKVFIESSSASSQGVWWTGHGSRAGCVAVAHDGIDLVVLPLLELVHRHVDVEFRIVGGSAEFPHIMGLEVDLLEGGFQSLLALDPRGVVLRHLFLRRQLDAAQDHISRVPSLRVEHREGIELVLHAEIHELWIVEPHDALVEVGRMHALQLIGQEREVRCIE
jgi:hypothetical protein